LLVGPIFVREAITVPRRFRHYLARGAYSSVLFILMWTAWQTMVGFQRIGTAGDLARFGEILFQFLAVMQVALALFFAPILAGSAISAEKDRRTFVLLLMTDLTNGEIVVGKLLSSLLQMSVLLAASLPILGLCLLLGGASMGQLLRLFAVTASTAFAAGALGIVIASWRDKTFQTLALTVLIVVLYLVLTEAVALLPEGWGVSPETIQSLLSPFHAVRAVLYPAPDRGPGPVSVEWGMIALMLAAAAVLIAVAVVTLRIWNPGGDRVVHKHEVSEEEEKRLFQAAHAHAKVESRSIWDNPILWREIRTRAYGRKPLLIKAAYVVLFVMICAYFAASVANEFEPGRLTISKAVVPVVVVTLILVNAQAVTAITSERDGRALDLLLVTDVTPKEFIFGKIWGVLFNTKEMIILPIGLCLYLLGAGYVKFEVWFYLVAGLAMLVTFSVTLGLHEALAYEKTRAAVANSLGTIFFLFVGILVCIFLILNGGRFESQLVSFAVFIFAGSIAMYASLSVRNPSPALALASGICPFLTWWAIVHLLPRGAIGSGGDPLGGFLAFGLSYGFATLAMLVPALSEFDVALGRTVAED
jgi:ABC-type transport system involved in multi-copper enzyme maturation permease subunit